MSESVSGSIHKILSWGVISVIVPCLVFIGLGVLAIRDPDDFIVAKVCFCLVCLIFAAKIVQLALLRKGQIMVTALLVFLGCGLLGLVGFGSIRYVNRKRDARVIKIDNPPASDIASQLPKPEHPTYANLQELFNQEISPTPNRPIAKQNTWTINLTAFPDEPIPVLTRLLIDEDAGVEYLGCYLPASTHAYQVTEILSDEIPRIIEHWKGWRFTSHPAGQRSVDLETAKFSGRVFLYHESRLTQAEIDKLSVVYREKGFEPLFRGPDYLIAKNAEGKPRALLDIKYEPRSPFATDTVGNSGIQYKTRTIAITSPIAGKVSLKIPILNVGKAVYPNVYLRPIPDQPDELEAGETGYWHVVQMNTQENQIRLMRKGNEKYPLGTEPQFVVEARCKDLVSRKLVTAKIQDKDLQFQLHII